MRAVRLLLYFVVGFMLSSVVVIVHAETTAPKWGYVGLGVYTSGYWTGTESPTKEATCALISNSNFMPAALRGRSTFVSGNYCNYVGVAGTNYPNSGTAANLTTLAYCDVSSGWVLQGATCTRPDCVAPETRDSATGLCKAPDCPAYSGTATDSLTQAPPPGCQCPSGSKWYPFNGCRKTCAWNAGEKVNAGWDMQYKAGGSVCAMGCESYGTGDYLIGKDGVRTGPVESSGWACGVGAPTSPVPPDDTAKIPEGAKHPPKCAATEGVMTSSSGNVLCVPEGTPAASKPNVESKKKTEVFPDNSTKTTETTKTTDPNTNATDTRSTTTSTGGQSGPAGTGTTTENTSGDSGSGSADGEGDEDGDCDPKKHFCSKPSTEGLYEKKETTFGGVLGKFTTDMKNTPIGQAVETTLNITVPSSGACPDLSANIPYLNTTIDLAPYLCTGKAIEYMEVMGTILKICVGYIALTWVFL